MLYHDVNLVVLRGRVQVSQEVQETPDAPD